MTALVLLGYTAIIMFEIGYIVTTYFEVLALTKLKCKKQEDKILYNYYEEVNFLDYLKITNGVDDNYGYKQKEPSQ